MFKSGKYKTVKPHVTIFKSSTVTAEIPEKGTVIEIVEVEEMSFGKIRGYLKDGSYIIMKNIKGDIAVEAVKAKKKEAK